MYQQQQQQQQQRGMYGQQYQGYGQQQQGYGQQYQSNYQEMRTGRGQQETPQGFRDEVHKVHSHVKQLPCANLDDAVSIFSSTHGSDGVVCVLVPEQRGIFQPWFEVPEGVTCLLEVRGQRQKEPAAPGLHVASWMTRVAYCVTNQLCTYDAPVSRCPTEDNVMCSVDVTVVFKIVNPSDFVYNLGCARFDDLLSVLIEEKVRTLMRSKRYKEIHALRGETARKLKDDLNDESGLKEGGVEFLDCKITGVWLPHQLADNLEKITKHEIKLEELEAEHKFKTLEIDQRANLTLEEIKKNNEQAKVKEASFVMLAKMTQTKEKLEMNRQSHGAILKAEEDAQVMKYSAEAQLRRAENEARKREKEEMNKARSDLLNKQLKAEADFKSGLAKSFDDVVIAKEKAETIKLQAQVEEAVGPQVRLQRQHELSLQSKKVLARLAEYGDYNMVGKEGDALIKSLLGGSLEAGLAG